MKKAVRILTGVLVPALLVINVSTALANDAEWFAEARKASCQQLSEAYVTTTTAERKVVAQMNSDRNGTVAANALGVATLAIFGFGLFTWNDNASAEENLADLRNDIRIITAVAAEKKCDLPK